MMNNEDTEIFVTIYLNIINISNLSSHHLKLKIDAFIILLHNLSMFTESFNEIYLYFIHIN